MRFMSNDRIYTDSESAEVTGNLKPGKDLKFLFSSDSEMGETTEFFLGESLCQKWAALWVRSSFMEEEGIFEVACIRGRHVN